LIRQGERIEIQRMKPEGAGTLETISMKRAGGNWKFGEVTRTQTK